MRAKIHFIVRRNNKTALQCNLRYFICLSGEYVVYWEHISLIGGIKVTFQLVHKYTLLRFRRLMSLPVFQDLNWTLNEFSSTLLLSFQFILYHLYSIKTAHVPCYFIQHSVSFKYLDSPNKYLIKSIIFHFHLLCQ